MEELSSSLLFGPFVMINTAFLDLLLVLWDKTSTQVCHQIPTLVKDRTLPSTYNGWSRPLSSYVTGIHSQRLKDTLQSAWRIPYNSDLD